MIVLMLATPAILRYSAFLHVRIGVLCQCTGVKIVSQID